MGGVAGEQFVVSGFESVALEQACYVLLGKNVPLSAHGSSWDRPAILPLIKLGISNDSHHPGDTRVD